MVPIQGYIITHFPKISSIDLFSYMKLLSSKVYVLLIWHVLFCFSGVINVVTSSIAMLLSIVARWRAEKTLRLH